MRKRIVPITTLALVLVWLATWPLAAASEGVSHPFTEIYARVGPAAVRIFDGSRHASGLIVSADGLVVTDLGIISRNEHLLYLPDQPQTRARVLVRDKKIGLAILQIITDPAPEETPGDVITKAGPEKQKKTPPPPRPSPERTWPAVTLGSSKDLAPGDWVASVAYPIGSDMKRLSSASVSAGVLAGRGKVRTGLRYTGDLLLTDATVNAGSEGGALADSRGRVVGILTKPQRHGETETALNLALPVELLPALLKRARENPDPPIRELAERAFLGVVRDDMADACRILAVAPDSAAERAGLRAGDVIIKADEQKIESFADLVDFLEDKRPGDLVNLKIRRAGKGNKNREIQVEVTLGKRPD
ncbi:MAG: PDZ domain-containing protein [Anaerolineaceae bacterium]|nr:PDZ domain-containing protein [Anaerolineaceae bacterium]